jgi:CII-binding regulator of phage lambda lysogenization HflD
MDVMLALNGVVQSKRTSQSMAHSTCSGASLGDFAHLRGAA